jgi:hypothetical protein
MIIDYRRERLDRGNIDLYRESETVEWRLSWAPDHGEPDWPGHTYSTQDEDLPSDFPDSGDVDALVEWGRKHFGP